VRPSGGVMMKENSFDHKPCHELEQECRSLRPQSHAAMQQRPPTFATEYSHVP
jgi:hypothetical protein